MRNLIRKELTALIFNPGFYLVYIIFVFSWFYAFFRNVFLVGFVSLSGLFEIYPWVLLIVVGALTMGTLAHEKEIGTLELLLTRPLSSLKIVLSKIITISGIITTSLLFVLPLAVQFNKVGGIDFGVLALQLFASLLLIILLVSLGVMISSFFESQISSLLTFVFVYVLLLVVDLPYVSLKLPSNLASLLSRFSVLAHYSSLSRGVFDLSDFLYFLILVFLFVIIAVVQLQRISRPYGVGYTIFQLILGAIGIFLIYAFTGLSLYRVDYTSTKSFTLSDVTISSLKQLNAPLKLTLYVSSNLPIQYAPIQKEAKYILYDLVQNGNRNVSLEIIDPSRSEDIAKAADKAGVNLTQFNVIGKEKTEIVKGFFGLVLQYKDKQETIPFISSIDGFEYTITSLIRKHLDFPKKTIKFIFGDGERDIDTDYLSMKTSLYGTYNVTSQNSNALTDDGDVLFIAGPMAQLPDKAIATIKSFLEKGKSLVFLIERFNADSSLTVVPNENSLAEFLEGYGIYVKKDLIFDLQSNENLVFNDGTNTFSVQYPFWIRSLYEPTTDFPRVSGLHYVSLPWVSSITYDPLKLSNYNLTAKPLLVTSDQAGLENTDFNIKPDRSYKGITPGKFTTGITLEHTKNNEGSGRSIIIGDSEFLTDQFLSRVPNNSSFALDMFSWLTKDTSMAQLQTKLSPLAVFHFESENQPEEIKRLMYILVIGIPLVVGTFTVLLRRLATSR